ncbi:MAG: hypothetical protein KA059_02020 [Elusimicrobiales bacterium]|jgi:tetratricopeptide (TPR) repeat protein|nr:hypothetical protein [Elusimicrobiales bacterium]
MQDFDNDATNKILNNFDSISKLYIELTQSTILNSIFFTSDIFNTTEIKTSDRNINFPYYSNKTELILLNIFNMRRDKDIVIDIDDTKYEINNELISFIIGYIRSKKEKHFTVNKAISSGDFHLAHYLLSIEDSDPYTISLIYTELGFLNEAEKILNGMTDDKSTILLARINRELGNIKKAVSLLSKVKSKENEIDRNIEYGLLHLETKNYENAYKIFKFYSNTVRDERLGRIIPPMVESLINIDNKEITHVIDLLNQTLETTTYYRTDILKQLASIYMTINDHSKAYESYKQIYDTSPSPYILSRMALCDFAMSNDDRASKETFECGVFDISLARDIISKIDYSHLKQEYPESFLFKAPKGDKSVEKTEDEQIEAVLKPENILKVSNTSTKVITEEKVDSTASDKSGTEESENEEKKSMEFISSYEFSNQGNNEYISEDTDTLSSTALSFSKQLEEEFGKKIYFNYDGIDDIERKLRVTFMTEVSENEKKEVIKGCSAFLLFFIKERYKADIITYHDIDSWAWSAIIKNKKEMEILTYPAARIWEIFWSKTLPEQGWIKKYIGYINDFFNNLTEETPYGKDAINKMIPSHTEKIYDAKIEHKKIVLISRDISETSHIPINSSSVIKIEQEIMKNYEPHVPPTIDGWKILRCYAHLFLEIILKDFNIQWYNVEKNDGLWSFFIGNNTYTFPIGKVYKVASLRESLTDYYNSLIENIKETH